MAEINILELLVTYGYWLYIPLILIEGNIVAITSGTLAGLGLFNPIFLWILFIIADLISDLVLFYVGGAGKSTIDKRPQVKKMMRRIFKTNSTEMVRTKFETYFEWIIVVAKLLPVPQLPTTVILLSGYYNISLKRFLKIFMIIEPIKASIYIAFGYYVGTGLSDLRYFVSAEGLLFATVIIGVGIGLILGYKYLLRDGHLSQWLDSRQQ